MKRKLFFWGTFLFCSALFLTVHGIASGVLASSPSYSKPEEGPTPTALPQVFWRGRIAQQYDAAMGGVIAVQVIGLRDWPVEISKEGWQATAYTGTKPDFGEFACEFSPLLPDLYLITPKDLGISLEVDLTRGGFALVEFAPYTDLPPPAPAPGCVMRVRNRSEVAVRLTIVDHEYDLPPGASKILAVNPGIHTYSISSYGYETISEETLFETGYWTWNISAGKALNVPQIEGIVLAPDGGTRLAAGEVRLGNKEGTVSKYSIISALEPFSFEGLAPGLYLLDVLPPGDSPFWPPDPIPITITEPRVVESQFITVTVTYAQIRGTVLEPDGETRLAAGEVGLLGGDQCAPPCVFGGLWAEIDPYQPFRFGGLAPGTYVLEVFLAEDSPFWPPESMSVTIPANGVKEPQTLEVRLTYPQVEGVVVGADGTTRLTAGGVSLWNEDGSIALWDEISPDRPFRFGGVPPGRYFLEVVPPEGSQLSPPEPLPITIEAGSQYRAPQRLTLKMRGPSLVGRVIYQGQPMAGVSVDVYNADGSKLGWTSTDDQGRFAIGGLEPDRYFVDVFLPWPQEVTHWLGPPTPIIFTLSEEQPVRDIGVIELIMWTDFLNHHLNQSS